MMLFTLQSVQPRISANREEINGGFFGGVTAIVKPTIFELSFYSLDNAVKVTVEIPEDHLYADEMAKLQKGMGQTFELEMK